MRDLDRQRPWSDPPSSCSPEPEPGRSEGPRSEGVGRPHGAQRELLQPFGPLDDDFAKMGESHVEAPGELSNPKGLQS
jgi:hypothetical protein